MHALRSLALWSLGALAACASSSDPDPSELLVATHSVTMDTPLYHDGPQQGRPPDGKITAGTLVRLLDRGGSYCRVEARTGQQGWISSGALRPLSGR